MRLGRPVGEADDLSRRALWPHRDPVDPSVIVADGYGISLTVSRGHLVIRDGLGRHRRERRLPRAQRTVRRIVILGHTGHISLEAIRWCHDTGVALMQVEPDGTLLLTSSPTGRDDARLRRSQAAAATSPHGLHLAQHLLTGKLTGQAALLRRHNLNQTAADQIERLRDELTTAPDLVTCRDLEAKAANIYFATWAASVCCTVAEQERARVPDHWTVFAARGSLLHRGGRSPRAASDPINALLNYGYTLLEGEATLAARAIGLDPGLGVLHTDKPNRDSFSLDLIEPLRPRVEDHVVNLLQVRRFKATDFVETPQGGCRIHPHLTAELATHTHPYAQELAVITEKAAGILAEAGTGHIRTSTPLSRANNSNSQTRGARSANRKPPTPANPMPSCRTCGTTLDDPKRSLCPSCWNVTRRQLAQQRAANGAAAIAAARANGGDPTNTPTAAAKRSASLSQRKHEELAWEDPPELSGWTTERYRDEILPRLQAQPLSNIQQATGLSISACSRIRSGQLLPHRRHWLHLKDAGNHPVARD